MMADNARIYVIETRDTKTGQFRYAGYYTLDGHSWLMKNLPGAYARGDARARGLL